MCRKLVLSCSKRKTNHEGLIPAIERYDGISFRLLRRYLKNSTEKLDVYILSAEFGLISHSEKIPVYERKMNQLRAQELKETISLQVKKLIFPKLNLNKNYWFINLGNPYQSAFCEGTDYIESVSTNVKFASGSSGKRLAEMYDWLYGEDSPLRNSKSLNRKSKIIYFRGKKINLTQAEIIKIARQNLKNADKSAFAFQSWFVEIDEKRVSPKWLVSKLTGLPVSSFHSDESRKLLHNSGVNVIRL